MSKTISLFLFSCFAASYALAQPTPTPAVGPANAKPSAQMNGGRPRLSTHETVSAKIDGSRVTITYGRPHATDPKSGQVRTIWGDLVPYGKVWRTGADEATTLITQKDLMIGGTRVPAGAYTLFTTPAADGSAKLIINKELGQWGIDPYHSEQELAQVDLKKEAAPTDTEQFTMAVEKNPAGGGLIKMTWATTQFSVPFTVAK